MGAMSPGPSVVVIINNTIRKNRINGIITSIGHGIGVTIYALLALMGLELLIISYYNIFLSFQIVGALFLIFLGIMTIFKSNNQINKSTKNNLISLNSFFQGFLIAFLNPKILIFFAALFSQFIYINVTFFDQVILVIVPGIVDTIWYIFVSIIVSFYTINDFIYNNKKLIEKITGTVLIIVAITLLFNLI